MSLENAFTRLRREIGIKRCVIIDGNVDDVYFEGSRFVNLEDKLSAMLGAMGYRRICFWDRVNGARGCTDELKLTDDIELDGENYENYEDYGNDGSALPAADTSLKDPTQMFSVILRNLTGDRKYAFVLNWASYLFGGSGTLNEEEMRQLTILGKAFCDKIPEHYFASGDDVNQSVVIIITKKLSMLPVPLYQGNPEVCAVNLSKPDRLERQTVLERLEDSFKISLNPNEAASHSERFARYSDLLDGFTNREMIQMARLSMKEPSMTFDKLYLLFKYGEKENPWEKLDYGELKRIDQTLSRRVVGQEAAVSRVREVVIKAYMGLSGIHKTSARNSPKGVLFFVGPTGVGKTELSKALAEFLFGDEQACIRFDMSEYSQENSDQKLIGAPPGYVGYEEGGQLTNAIREKPFSIILFDEIEKAAVKNPRILDIFLQILEDGRLTDSKGETVYFNESVIVFTSNIGSGEIAYTDNAEANAAAFKNRVIEFFNKDIGRPELLGRIGYKNIVAFNFISDAGFRQRIASSKLIPIKEKIMEKYKLELQFEDEAEFVGFIVSRSGQSKGGRDILNAINDILLDELSVFLFENRDDLSYYKNKTLVVSVNREKNKPEFDFR